MAAGNPIWGNQMGGQPQQWSDITSLAGATSTSRGSFLDEPATAVILSQTIMTSLYQKGHAILNQVLPLNHHSEQVPKYFIIMIERHLNNYIAKRGAEETTTNVPTFFQRTRIAHADRIQASSEYNDMDLMTPLGKQRAQELIEVHARGHFLKILAIVLDTLMKLPTVHHRYLTSRKSSRKLSLDEYRAAFERDGLYFGSFNTMPQTIDSIIAEIKNLMEVSNGEIICDTLLVPPLLMQRLALTTVQKTNEKTIELFENMFSQVPHVDKQVPVKISVRLWRDTMVVLPFVTVPTDTQPNDLTFNIRRREKGLMYDCNPCSDSRIRYGKEDWCFFIPNWDRKTYVLFDFLSHCVHGMKKIFTGNGINPTGDPKGNVLKTVDDVLKLNQRETQQFYKKKLEQYYKQEAEGNRDLLQQPEDRAAAVQAKITDGFDNAKQKEFFKAVAFPYKDDPNAANRQVYELAGSDRVNTATWVQGVVAAGAFISRFAKSADIMDHEENVRLTTRILPESTWYNSYVTALMQATQKEMLDASYVVDVPTAFNQLNADGVLLPGTIGADEVASKRIYSLAPSTFHWGGNKETAIFAKMDLGIFLANLDLDTLAQSNLESGISAGGFKNSVKLRYLLFVAWLFATDLLSREWKDDGDDFQTIMRILYTQAEIPEDVNRYTQPVSGDIYKSTDGLAYDPPVISKFYDDVRTYRRSLYTALITYLDAARFPDGTSVIDRYIVPMILVLLPMTWKDRVAKIDTPLPNENKTIKSHAGRIKEFRKKLTAVFDICKRPSRMILDADKYAQDNVAKFLASPISRATIQTAILNGIPLPFGFRLLRPNIVFQAHSVLFCMGGPSLGETHTYNFLIYRSATLKAERQTIDSHMYVACTLYRLDGGVIVPDVMLNYEYGMGTDLYPTYVDYVDSIISTNPGFKRGADMVLVLKTLDDPNDLDRVTSTCAYVDSLQRSLVPEHKLAKHTTTTKQINILVHRGFGSFYADVWDAKTEKYKKSYTEGNGEPTDNTTAFVSRYERSDNFICCRGGYYKCTPRGDMGELVEGNSHIPFDYDKDGAAIYSDGLARQFLPKHMSTVVGTIPV